MVMYKTTMPNYKSFSVEVFIKNGVLFAGSTIRVVNQKNETAWKVPSSYTVSTHEVDFYDASLT